MCSLLQAQIGVPHVYVAIQYRFSGEEVIPNITPASLPLTFSGFSASSADSVPLPLSTHTNVALSEARALAQT